MANSIHFLSRLFPSGNAGIAGVSRILLVLVLAGACLSTVYGAAVVPVTLSNTLAANDDGSTGPVNLGIGGQQGINFFGQNFTRVYVNNNGNLTFQSAFGTYTPQGLSTVGQPIIAPFFADVDTRGSGNSLVQYGNATINGRNAFVANYVNVGYFSAHTDKLNSFQVILIDRSDTGPGNFDIQFNYDRIQWETGDASGGVSGLGGTSAAAGYSNGLPRNQNVTFQLPGSLVNGAFLDNGRNSLAANTVGGSAVPGRYDFAVRNGVPQTPTNLTLTVNPQQLSFVQIPGNPAAAPQGISATTNDPAAVITASPSVATPPGANWLAVTVEPPGTNPAVIRVSVTNLNGIAPGGYTGSVVVNARNAETGGTASVIVPVDLTIGNPLVLTTACPLPGGAADSPYGPVTLTATGGNGTYTFSAPTGLPPGLTLSGNTISGILGFQGVFPFTLQVSSGGQVVQKSCSIAVSAPSLQITSACPSAPIFSGEPFALGLSATGGSGTYSWVLAGGTLPPGLSLSGNSISGTPTGTGGTYGFTVQVTSFVQVATFSCSITVNPPRLRLTSGCPGNGVVNAPYGPVSLSATGGLGGTSYSFSIAGSLPAGLSLSGSTISGVPTGPPGASNFSIRVTSGTQTVTGPSCTVNITAPPPPALQITGTCPTQATPAGTAFSSTISVTGGRAPYTYSISGPSWLSVTGGPQGATISGTAPLQLGGPFPFTVTVTDSANATTTFSCSVTVGPALLQITGATCSSAPVQTGSPFSLGLTATGGLAPYRWTINGPAWLALSSPNGASTSLTGTPASTDVGNAPFTVTLQDSANNTTTFSCTLNVQAPQVPPLQITAGAGCPTSALTLPATLSVPLAASGGQQPYRWTLSGPSWLTLSSATGVNTTVSGSAPAPGAVSFTATLNDSANSTPATYTCSFTLNPPVVPTVSVSGLGTPSNLLQPVFAGLSLASPATVPLQGEALLTFTPNAANATDNPQVKFNGPSVDAAGRRVAFTIAAGQTTASLPDVVPGTVAGTIRLEVVSLRFGDVSVLPVNRPFSELVIPRSAPVIQTVDLTNTSGGFDVVITGFSTPRDLNSVTLTFAPKTDATLDGPASFTVSVGDLFSRFYASAASLQGGSTFTGLRIPVNIEGDQDVLASVTVTLTNSSGTSAGVTKTR